MRRLDNWGYDAVTSSSMSFRRKSPWNHIIPICKLQMRKQCKHMQIWRHHGSYFLVDLPGSHEQHTEIRVVIRKIARELRPVGNWSVFCAAGAHSPRRGERGWGGGGICRGEAAKNFFEPISSNSSFFKQNFNFCCAFKAIYNVFFLIFAHNRHKNIINYSISYTKSNNI